MSWIQVELKERWVVTRSELVHIIHHAITFWVQLIPEIRVKSAISNTGCTTWGILFEVMMEAGDMIAIVSSDSSLVIILKKEWGILETTKSSTINTCRTTCTSKGKSSDYYAASGVFINNCEWLIIIRSCGSRGKWTLLLKFSFATSFLHIGEGAVRKWAAESLSFLAVQVRVKWFSEGLPSRLGFKNSCTTSNYFFSYTV